MTNPAEILPGVIFYSYLSSQRKDKVCFWANHALVLMVSGRLGLETSGQSLVTGAGDVLLISKNQLGTLTKTPLDIQPYESIVISLQEELLRRIALEERLLSEQKYQGPLNIQLPPNAYLQGFFQSIMPYARTSAEPLSEEMGILKVKEAVKLLLHIQPGLKNLLFDFSHPHKIDLEHFMVQNYHYNIPVERFAQLTGRSLAAFKRDFHKLFGQPPRRWLQEKRLGEARHLIEQQRKRPTDIYLDLGFESLSHFSRSYRLQFGHTPTAITT
ncbi:helix-turn-helix transcriptional regulator [Mucilaginibacter auburnensis]|uniref:AraC-like DNA-binding protein n=1 Tax=Mucilaginibacter auburnensis TaxID=1457233 RepID=A0A2H9VLQ7_9SPHI|nr:AraC family transcriptional regulator [Mucilaginibacter auburnensis]PJJ79270.1 AraC-like DNA-binding protein [Mucilaginibacter auburnensis]